MHPLVMEACVLPGQLRLRCPVGIGGAILFKSSLLCTLYFSQGITAAHCLAHYSAGKKKVLLRLRASLGKGYETRGTESISSQ